MHQTPYVRPTIVPAACMASMTEPIANAAIWCAWIQTWPTFSRMPPASTPLSGYSPTLRRNTSHKRLNVEEEDMSARRCDQGRTGQSISGLTSGRMKRAWC